MHANQFGPALVVGPDGRTTHVLVPKDQYDELVRARASAEAERGPDDRAVSEALRILHDPKTRWRDGNEVMRDIAAEGVAAVRKSRGLSQQELARKLGVAQSQVSRYENNFDGLTMRVLKRIAGVLSGREVAKQQPKKRRSATGARTRRKR